MKKNWLPGMHRKIGIGKQKGFGVQISSTPKALKVKPTKKQSLIIDDGSDISVEVEANYFKTVFDMDPMKLPPIARIEGAKVIKSIISDMKLPNDHMDNPAYVPTDDVAPAKPLRKNRIYPQRDLQDLCTSDDFRNLDLSILTPPQSSSVTSNDDNNFQPPSPRLTEQTQRRRQLLVNRAPGHLDVVRPSAYYHGRRPNQLIPQAFDINGMPSVNDPLAFGRAGGFFPQQPPASQLMQQHSQLRQMLPSHFPLEVPLISQRPPLIPLPLPPSLQQYPLALPPPIMVQGGSRLLTGGCVPLYSVNASRLNYKHNRPPCKCTAYRLI